MKANLFNYYLPPDRIAQKPLEKRDGARMLVLDRKTGHLEHSMVKDLPHWLLQNDLLVINETKVIPARLFAVKAQTGGRIEIFLLRPAIGQNSNEWEALVAPAKRIKGLTRLLIEPRGEAEVLESLGEGHFLIRFTKIGNFKNFLEHYGHVPLPPYIKRTDNTEDRKRYQTIFAKKEGSVAAPTAGLHFTKPLFEALRKKGIQHAEVVLHVGLGTFLPVTAEVVEDHVMHPEKMEISTTLISAIQRTRLKNGRVVAVGTTVVRALESASRPDGSLLAGEDETRLYITPGYPFKTVDAIFTNFHQPQSTLLMLICAFAGRERILAAYAEALQKGYRFLSYGDAMLIL